MSDSGLIILIVSLATLIFLGVALILLVVVPTHMKHKNAVCRQPVPARIVGFRKVYLTKHSSYMHSPNIPGKAPSYTLIYEFMFNGQTYSKETSYVTSKKPTIGEVRTLMINPDNMEQFVDPIEQKRARTIVTIVGAAMLCMGLLTAVVGSLVIMALPL